MTLAPYILPPQTVDVHYAIIPGGALPTLEAAFAQAAKDKSQWPAFHFAPGSINTLTYALPKGFQGITIDGGAVGSPQSSWAVINSGASGPGNAAIAALNMPNVHISRLTFNAKSPTAARAVYCNGVSGFAIDNCVVNGFAIGVCSDGANGFSVTNCGLFNQSAPGIGKSQGVFFGATQNWLIAGNTFYHCGWSSSDYNPTAPAATIQAQNNLLQLNHAIYANNDATTTTDGSIRGNIFVDCASSGINSRVGGVYDYNVFRSNGLAADVVIQGNAGSVLHSVFFGPVVDQPPYYGGGIDGISQSLTVNDCYFFNTAITPQNAAVRADWKAGTPLPVGTTASIDGIHGVWVKPAIGIAPGRTVTQGVVDIKTPTPGVKYPTLEGYYGCTPAQLEATLRARVGMNDAPLIHDWTAQQWTAIVAPGSPVPPVIPSVPVPVTSQVTLGGVTYNVTYTQA